MRRRRAATDAEIAQMQAHRARRDARAARSALRAAPARPTTATAACRCPRAWRTTARWRRWSTAMGEGGPRRLHADQGRPHDGAVSRVARSQQRQAGDDRGAAAQQHQSASGVRRSRRDRRTPTRAASGCIGQVSCCPLTMDFTLASPYPVEGLASWKPALGLAGDALKAVLADTGVSRRGCAPSWRPAPRFRLFNGEWDKVQVVEVARPENACYEQRNRRRDRASRGSRSAGRHARSRPRRGSGDRVHRRSFSTPTKMRWVACSTIRTAS